MKKWHIIAAIVAVVAIIVGFRVWLASHDRDLLQAERDRVRLEQLQTENTRLTSEVQALKVENQRIQVETDRKIAQIVAERAKAQTPAEQVTYIASNSPLHPTLEVPNLVFPNTDTPILADILADRAQLQVKLAGCEQQKGNLETAVSDLQQVAKNKDEEIKIEKGKKNASTGQKAKAFGFGAVAGAILTVALILL